MKPYLSKVDCAKLRFAAMYDDPLLVSRVLSKKRHAWDIFKKVFTYNLSVEETLFEEILSLCIQAGSIETLSILLKDDRFVGPRACQRALDTLVRVMDKPSYCDVYDVRKIIDLLFIHPILRHFPKPEGFISHVVRYGHIVWVSELAQKPMSLRERFYLPIRCAIEQSNEPMVEVILNNSDDFYIEGPHDYCDFKKMLAEEVKFRLKNKDFRMARYLIEHPKLRLIENACLMGSIVNYALDDIILDKIADNMRAFILPYSQIENVTKLEALLIVAVKNKYYALLFDLLKVPLLMERSRVGESGIQIDYHQVSLFMACALWSYPGFCTKGLNCDLGIEPNAFLETSKDACAIRLRILHDGIQGLISRGQTDAEFSPFTWNSPDSNLWALKNCLTYLNDYYQAQITQYAQKLLDLRNNLFFQYKLNVSSATHLGVAQNLDKANSKRLVSRFEGSFDRLPEELIDVIMFKMVENSKLKFALSEIQSTYRKLKL